MQEASFFFSFSVSLKILTSFLLFPRNFPLAFSKISATIDFVCAFYNVSIE